MYLRNYFAKIACRYYFVYFLYNKINKTKKIKIIVIIKNNIAIRIAGKVSRYIAASMNRATPTKQTVQLKKHYARLYHQYQCPSIECRKRACRQGLYARADIVAIILWMTGWLVCMRHAWHKQRKGTILVNWLDRCKNCELNRGLIASHPLMDTSMAAENQITTKQRNNASCKSLCIQYSTTKNEQIYANYLIIIIINNCLMETRFIYSSLSISRVVFN